MIVSGGRKMFKDKEIWIEIHICQNLGILGVGQFFQQQVKPIGNRLYFILFLFSEEKGNVVGGFGKVVPRYVR